MKRIVSIIAVAVAVTFAGSVSAVAKERLLRVGLYTDEGSRGRAFVTWAEMLGASPDVTLTMLSGEDLRKGKLKHQDVLVMPGGSGFDQYESMQESGAAAIREFVRKGGRYFGTCAGNALLLNETNRVALLPYRRIDGHYLRGGGDLKVVFDEAGAARMGLAEREWTVRFGNGPILVPAEPVAGVTATVLATCANAVDEKPTRPADKDKMIGTPAFVYATYGKGRILACICHPEARAETRALIAHGFAALTDKTVRFPELKPPHRIPAGMVNHVRDLGGWKGLGGKTVKTGHVYRTGCYNNGSTTKTEVGADGVTNKVHKTGVMRINDANRNFFGKGLKIKTDIDLRFDGEVWGMTGSPLGTNVVWKHLPILPYRLPTVDKGVKPKLKEVFDVILNEKNHPVAFHCALGRDRTGLVAMLTLAALGVSEDDIMADYCASWKVPRERMLAVIAELRQKWPAPTLAESAEKYLVAIGIAPEQIAAFRKTMLEE